MGMKKINFQLFFHNIGIVLSKKYFLLFLLAILFLIYLLSIGVYSIYSIYFTNDEETYFVRDESESYIGLVVSSIQETNGKSVIYITVNDFLLYRSDEKYCLKSITFFPFVSNNNSFYKGKNFPGNLYNLPFYNPDKLALNGENKFTFTKPYCSSKEKYVEIRDTDSWIPLVENTFAINIVDNNLLQNFNYPFDTRHYEISIQIEVENEYGVPHNIYPKMAITIPSQSWDTSVSEHPTLSALKKWGFDDFESFEKSGGLDSIQFYLTYERLAIVKIFTCVIVGMVFLSSILMIFIQELGNAVGVASSLLLGIWGIKEVIIPNSTNGQLTFILLLVYYFFAITVFIRFVIIPLFHKYKQK